MKKWLFLLIFFYSILVQNTNAQNLTLIQNLRSDYTIVLSKSPSVNEKLAANELQKYLKQISNVNLPISNDMSAEHQIIVGNDDYIKNIDPTINFLELETDGFIIKQKGSKLIFAGGTEKGILYAVYTFLETYLNCRMYASDAIIIPKRNSVILTSVYNKQIPQIKYRETYYWPSNDNLYTNWHKVDHYLGSNSLWGNWVHSFLRLVPPDQFYKQHPEYFAQINGKRIPSQLCLSNPDVYKLVVDNLKKNMLVNPNAKYWSVSQADNSNYCQCDLCKAVDDREGGPSGSIISFVNKVAKNFPDKIINTLAYSYSVVPPKTLKPLDNVLVTFCTSGNLDRGIPYHLNTKNNIYLDNLNKWGRISKRFMVWDYIVDFKDFTMPFPNLDVIGINIKKFANNNADALFIQGNYYGGGEFAELKCYLVSKLMWDPSGDPQKIITEFLTGYYGSAAPFIQKYINTLMLAYKNSNAPLGIFDTTDDHILDFLNSQNLNNYLVILKGAEKSVVNNPAILKRIKRITASVEYAMVKNGAYSAISSGRITKNINGNLLYINSQKKQLNAVYQSLEEQKVVRMSEPGITPDDYKKSMLSVYDTTESMFVPDNLALNKKITLTYRPTLIHAKYAGNNALIDGIRGNITSGLNTWQAFYGGKFEAVVDLLKPIALKTISINFLATPLVNITYPDEIHFYFSNDGENYVEMMNVETTIVDNDGKSEIKSYTINGKPQVFRYIKISASNKMKWGMLTDEIIIK